MALVFLFLYRVLPGFTGLYRVIPGFTGFYWVLLGFTGFYWVLLGFTGFSGPSVVTFFLPIPRAFPSFYSFLQKFPTPLLSPININWDWMEFCCDRMVLESFSVFKDLLGSLVLGLKPDFSFFFQILRV